MRCAVRAILFYLIEKSLIRRGLKINGGPSAGVDPVRGSVTTGSVDFARMSGGRTNTKPQNVVIDTECRGLQYSAHSGSVFNPFATASVTCE
jgi:hypothetical protein